MTEFKASLVAFEVQKSFANKFFSNKTVAKTLIDDTSSHLLDNLYLLLYVFVSINSPYQLLIMILQLWPDRLHKNIWHQLILSQITDKEQERFWEDNQKHNKDLNQAGNAATGREIQRRGEGESDENPEEPENSCNDPHQFLRSWSHLW